MPVSEKIADLRVVVERKDKSSFDGMEPPFQVGGILAAEIKLVQLALPVWRIQVEHCSCPVIPGQNLFVRQALDLHILQAAVSCFDNLWNPPHIVIRSLHHTVMVMLFQDQSAE